MQAPKASGTRQQIAAVLLKLLAIGFAFPAIPFLVEGLGNLRQGEVLWPLLCFTMAAVPLAISYGLWRRQRWGRTAALWVSIVAIPLLPVLTFLFSILSFDPIVTTIALALFLGLFAALIVYFLTSPQTKALFGLSAENASPRRPMIPRPVLGTVLLAALVVVGGLGAVSIVSHVDKLRRQAAQAAIDERINERIAGELKPLIEAEPRSMGAQGFVSRHCGVYQSLVEARLTRGRTLKGGSRSELHGVAHFEKADLYVRIEVADGGQANVELRFWPDENWLKEHPQARVRIVDRRLVVSADFGRADASARGGTNTGAVVVGSSGDGHIDGTAIHPDVVLSN